MTQLGADLQAANSYPPRRRFRSGGNIGMGLATILAISTTLLVATASPALAGVGECVWKHLPQDVRDKAIAPAAVPVDHQHFAAAASTVSAQNLNAALAACGVHEKEHDLASEAYENYADRVWAEHRLFLYEPHFSPRQLDDAWRRVDVHVKRRIARNPDPQLMPDLDLALSELCAAIHNDCSLSREADEALNLYVLSRVHGDGADQAFAPQSGSGKHGHRRTAVEQESKHAVAGPRSMSGTQP